MTGADALSDARDIMELGWHPCHAVVQEVAARSRYTYDEVDERIYAAVVDAIAGMLEGR